MDAGQSLESRQVMGRGPRIILLLALGALFMAATPVHVPQSDPAAARRSAESFNNAFARIPAGDDWLSSYLRLTGDDDTALRLFSKPKFPVLPNTWSKMTTLQRTEWLEENGKKVEPLLMRIRTPQGALRWVYILEVKVGGMVLTDTKPDPKGIKVEIAPRPPNTPSDKKPAPKSRAPKPKWELFVLEEDSENPVLKRKRGDAMPAQSYFIPIVFAGDGFPTLRPENYRPEFLDHLQELGYNAGSGSIKGLGKWTPGGQMLPAVNSPRALLHLMGHELPPPKKQTGS